MAIDFKFKLLTLLVLLTIGLTSIVSASCGPFYPSVDEFHASVYRDDLEYPRPEWSPNGEVLIFEHDGIAYSIDPEGFNLQVIHKEEPDADFDYSLSPGFSPDGARVVYSAFRNKGKRTLNPWDEEVDYGWEIMTANPDGSEQRRLTESEYLRLANLSPVWSPDGTRIAYFSNRLVYETTGEDREHGFRLFTMNADGSDKKAVLRSVAAILIAPEWSPDGRYIAIVGQLEGESAVARRHNPDSLPLYVVNIEGTKLTKIGETIARPAWSPDGSRIAFIGRGDRTTAIYTVAPDGSNLTKILEREDRSASPSIRSLDWSPDGNQLAVGGGRTVEVMDADGSNLRFVVNGNTRSKLGSLYPSWSPDGQEIAIYSPRMESNTLFPFHPAVTLLATASDGSAKRSLAMHKYDPEPAERTDYRWSLEQANGWLWPEGEFEVIVTATPTATPAPSGQSKPASVPDGKSAKATSSHTSPGPTASSTETSECTNGSCDSRDVSWVGLFSLGGLPAGPGDSDVLSVEEVLEKGLYGLETSPTHIVVQGTGQSDSVRCAWLPSALTASQREESIRFWLAKGDNETIPSPSEVEAEFMIYIDQMDPRYRDLVKAMYLPIARGGVSTELVTLVCYTDYTVSSFILGGGPTQLTLAHDTKEEARSYDLYSRAHAAGEFGTEPLMTEAAYERMLADRVSDVESMLAGLFEGRQSVLFLAPMGAQRDIAVEAWQVVAQWDIQTGSGGRVNAIRYGADTDDPEYSQTLANLRTRITTAAGSDDFSDDRIANVSGLTAYYREIGAYGDITPDDGSTDTFTPEQPPDVPPCQGSSVVPNPRTNTELVDDCGVLLEIKDALAGTGSLNWSADTALSGWNGVSTGESPKRVTSLSLPSRSLSGVIPAELGELSGLQTLNLQNNVLTGEIPEELGVLPALTYARLSGNTLTGCVPAGLRSVSNSDFTSLGIPYCDARAPAPTGLSTSLSDYTFTFTWNEVSGAVLYDVEYRISGSSEDDWTSAGTSEITSLDFALAAGLLLCDTYEFRVTSQGDGVSYIAEYGDPSMVVNHLVEVCSLAPVFDEESYSFEIPEGVVNGAVVGSVSATDPDEDDTVTYSITSGNEDGKFAVDETEGEITVAGVLDYETTASYTLTVQASDDSGSASEVAVEISVTEVTVFWAATLTVADVGGYLGYGTVSGSSGGSLSSAEWSYGGVSYIVTHLLYNEHFERLGLDLSSTVASVDNLTLNVGDLHLRLADSTVTGRQYFWGDVELNWNVGDAVTVVLSDGPTDPSLIVPQEPTPVPTPEPTPIPTASPVTPDRPSGLLTAAGTVALDWNDVEGASSYEVRFWYDSAWLDLSEDEAVNGITLEFGETDLSSATVRGLPTDSSYEWYFFSVRAVNSIGSSDWALNNAVRPR